MTTKLFPNHRARRLRKYDWVRDLSNECRVHASDLVLPVFVHESKQSVAISNMPGVMRLGLDDLLVYAQRACEHGIRAIMLFPVVDASKKDALGSEALNENNIMCQAVRLLQSRQLPLGIIGDVALDPYTTHGHDGVLSADGDVDNDATVTQLVAQSLLLAECGVDVIAPSDMQDGRVGAIRQALEQHNHPYVCIMSYTAKYASSFYGPFRDAVDAKGLQQSSNTTSWRGDKKTYQMSVANAQEALHAANTQLYEGADMLIVKPAMYYLDIVQRICHNTSAVVAAYQVSGEYNMLHALAKSCDTDPTVLFAEAALACKRAGAQIIISYAAVDIAASL